MKSLAFKFDVQVVNMFTLVQTVGFLAVVVACVSSASLPSYITPCSKSKDFSKCALESGRNAIPHLAKGDKQLKLRVLEPLKIPKIDINTSGNLKLALTDVTLFGLGQMKLNDLKFDLDNQKLTLDMRNEEIKLIGDYKIDGKILILPITGQGKINLKLVNGIIGYSFGYDFVEREGKKYINPHKPEVKLDSERIYYQLDNLFNGDKRLGDEMNKFLNENHEEMTKELNPSIEQTISAIASEIVNNVVGKVPYDELVLL